MTSNKLADIISAAIMLFQKKGYHATSMQDIADAVGLQKGSLYHYISSKEDLLICIVQEAVDTYADRLQEIVNGPLPPRERMAEAVRNHLRGIATNLGALTIFLREAHALTPDQQSIVQEGTDRYNRLFEELYTEGVQQGAFRDLNPKLACRTLLGTCNWFYRWYRPGGPLSWDELADFVVDVLFNGVVNANYVIGADRSSQQAK